MLNFPNTNATVKNTTIKIIQILRLLGNEIQTPTWNGEKI